MKRAHAELFERISWPAETVLEEMMTRCGELGLEIVLLPTWYSVDEGATLAMLIDELLEGKAPTFTTSPGFGAPHTREFLLGLTPPEVPTP